MSNYLRGLKDGLPVGLGYFSVSFAFGVAAVQSGLSVFTAVMISLTNLTSAGQLAGLSVIAAAGSLIEMAVTQLVINLRYALMSISLSQKLDSSVRAGDRFLMSFGITDENFAIAVAQKGTVTASYFYGLMTLPILCWTGGTLIGAAAGSILPASVLSALGVAIYGMFVAIILPAAKRSMAVAGVALGAAALACCFEWVPVLNRVSGGFAIIICAVIAAAVGALLRPVEDEA
ncbi:MAG: AzlC family ABC transporter permease [Clostridia bacterium]|nr:AzlC family ABC transporter permease [Clostridia bacterium]